MTPKVTPKTLVRVDNLSVGDLICVPFTSEIAIVTSINFIDYENVNNIHYYTIMRILENQKNSYRILEAQYEYEYKPYHPIWGGVGAKTQPDPRYYAKLGDDGRYMYDEDGRRQYDDRDLEDFNYYDIQCITADNAKKKLEMSTYKTIELIQKAV